LSKTTQKKERTREEINLNLDLTSIVCLDSVVYYESTKGSKLGEFHFEEDDD
jgi:hypothetical protein